jgi:hypothetical protein
MCNFAWLIFVICEQAQVQSLKSIFNKVQLKTKVLLKK